MACLADCASSAPLAAPASLWVDPARDVVLVPQDVCPKFGGWIAMTQDAVRLDELQKVERETQHAVALAQCQGAAQAASARSRSAVRAAESADWWSRYGFVLGLAGGIVVGGVAAAAGALVAQRVRFWARRCRPFTHCFMEAH